MRTLLFGGSGLVGNGFALLARNFEQPAQRIPWGNVDATNSIIERTVRDFIEASDDEQWRIVWAAGVGKVGVSQAVMESETAALQCLAATVRSAGTPERGQIVFSSSAGALFSGVGSAIVTDDTEPRPANSYGEHKVRQEAVLTPLANLGYSVVLCRFSNVYGLRADGSMGGGLIAAGITAAMSNKPLQVYVSQDSRRDYIFNRDAASIALQYADELGPGLHKRIVCSNTTRTVSEVVQTVSRLLRRRVPVLYAERPETRQQPQVIQLSSERGRGQLTSFPASVVVMIRRVR